MPNALYIIDLRDGIHVVHFRRDLFDATAIESMRADLRAVIEGSKAPRVVVDCQGLKQVSSVFLGALLEISLKLRGHAQGTSLRLCAMTPAIREVFGVMRLDQSVQIHATLAEAVKSFGSPTAPR